MRAPRRMSSRAAALSAVLLFAAGCGLMDDGDKVPKTATGTVEQLAKKAECKPDIQVDAADLRQGMCDAGNKRKYVLATFKSNTGQQDWLSSAQAYGGSYLVGPKWVAAGDADVIGDLRGKLGGNVEKAPDHEGHGGGSEGGEDHGGKDHEDKTGKHGGSHQGG
ncbi:hypothetical protein [Streptomyces sp. NPDC048639]|uniref:hypothetical protein n=1 Tax=Streptomyces sp. NPDC048639 TaxID=3365581 RepID=UPI0037207CF0